MEEVELADGAVELGAEGGFGFADVGGEWGLGDEALAAELPGEGFDLGEAALGGGGNVLGKGGGGGDVVVNGAIDGELGQGAAEAGAVPAGGRPIGRRVGGGVGIEGGEEEVGDGGVLVGDGLVVGPVVELSGLV